MTRDLKTHLPIGKREKGGREGAREKCEENRGDGGERQSCLLSPHFPPSRPLPNSLPLSDRSSVSLKKNIKSEKISCP